ncbi:hypothetical protein GCM10027294_12220 [Marinactinospora endophytica]
MNAFRPQLTESTIQDTGEHAILVPTCMDRPTLVLHPIAGRILALCDGSRTLNEVIDEIASTHNAERGRVATDITNLLVKVGEHGLLREQLPAATHVSSAETL